MDFVTGPLDRNWIVSDGPFEDLTQRTIVFHHGDRPIVYMNSDQKYETFDVNAGYSAQRPNVEEQRNLACWYISPELSTGVYDPYTDNYFMTNDPKGDDAIEIDFSPPEKGHELEYWEGIDQFTRYKGRAAPTPFATTAYVNRGVLNQRMGREAFSFAYKVFNKDTHEWAYKEFLDDLPLGPSIQLHGSQSMNFDTAVVAKTTVRPSGPQTYMAVRIVDPGVPVFAVKPYSKGETTHYGKDMVDFMDKCYDVLLNNPSIGSLVYTLAYTGGQKVGDIIVNRFGLWCNSDTKYGLYLDDMSWTTARGSWSNNTWPQISPMSPKLWSSREIGSNDLVTIGLEGRIYHTMKEQMWAVASGLGGLFSGLGQAGGQMWTLRKQQEHQLALQGNSQDFQKMMQESSQAFEARLTAGRIILGTQGRNWLAEQDYNRTVSRDVASAQSNSSRQSIEPSPNSTLPTETQSYDEKAKADQYALDTALYESEKDRQSRDQSAEINARWRATRADAPSRYTPSVPPRVVTGPPVPAPRRLVTGPPVPAPRRPPRARDGDPFWDLDSKRFQGRTSRPRQDRLLDYHYPASPAQRPYHRNPPPWEDDGSMEFASFDDDLYEEPSQRSHSERSEEYFGTIAHDKAVPEPLVVPPMVSDQNEEWRAPFGDVPLPAPRRRDYDSVRRINHPERPVQSGGEVSTRQSAVIPGMIPPIPRRQPRYV